MHRAISIIISISSSSISIAWATLATAALALPVRVPVYVPSLDDLAHVSDPLPQLSLVETLPVGDFDLQSTVLQTADVLVAHTNQAQRSIDLSAMYWNLLGTDDRTVYTDPEMSAFGADRGAALFHALSDAAARGVKLRVLTSKEGLADDRSGSAHRNESSLPPELKQLVDAHPKQVSVHCWGGPEWYGGGILHQKLWIFDHTHVYVGSANMDWKSLAQVMEMGVFMEHLPPSSPWLQDVQKLFDTWWHWADRGLEVSTATYFSPQFEAPLQVPSWSLFLPSSNRTADPFVRAQLQSSFNIRQQALVQFAPASTPPSRIFLSAAPLEATVAHSRAFDEDALVYTIRSARQRVSLSVMDFTPYSMYSLKSHPAPIWWPALTDALLAGVFAKRGLHVRLLISEWQHTNKQMLEALQLLQEQGRLCEHMRSRCTGRLEVRIFRVPGWKNTTSIATKKPRWPPFTRVNHAKYIVSDTRANIGTSNMEWGYFYTTAGMSVNTDHEELRASLEAVFDRNWNSSYASPLE
ncbi:TPA: hypothetical protein N0F65_009149 [Lagenidium giganteum]|uniref:PLD phosphodiesterase domain-containing protein n=1 Tax=Lagenidium giganteum TaxID=4803 RepID=A0AAV2YNR5_9STRA|nr:TPA: hypothetical protein N0F65_009149 [Lagenidium giganteum]